MFGSGPFPFARPPRALRPCVRSPAGPPRPPRRRIAPARRAPRPAESLRPAASPLTRRPSGPPCPAGPLSCPCFTTRCRRPMRKIRAGLHKKWRRSMVKGPFERDGGLRISDGFRARVSHLRFCRDPSIGAPSAFFKESNLAVFCANRSLEDASKVSRTLLGGRAVCGVSASSSGSLPRAPAIVFRDACGSCPRSHRWRLGCPARHW